jgi:hypothetical protein
MKMLVRLMLVMALGLSLVSCANEKGAATAAIKAATDSWVAVKDNAMKIMPTEAKAIDDAIAAAQGMLDGGDAKAAVAAAKAIPDQIKALSDGLAAKETELKAAWEAYNSGMPAVVASIQERVDILGKSKKLPADLDQAAYDGAKATLADATTMWNDAQTAFQSGNLADAVGKAESVKKSAVDVMTALKMEVPAGMQ